MINVPKIVSVQGTGKCCDARQRFMANIFHFDFVFKRRFKHKAGNLLGCEESLADIKQSTT